jgi:tetratricopeptide (TPR) repeat protein
MRIGVLVMLACAAPALADEESPSAALFREGRELLDAGNPAEACAKFAESYKLDATAAGTMLNLGLCNEQLGKVATALRWFRKALAQAAETGLTQTAEAARLQSGALAERVATLTIDVTVPAGATVTLDGTKLDPIDFARVEVDAGPHVVALAGPKLLTTRKTVDVVDGTNTRIALAVAPVPVVAPKPAPPANSTVLDPGRSQRRMSYLVGGGGLVALGGSLAITLVARSEYNKAETPDRWRYWQSVARYPGTSLAVIGGAAVAYGVWLYVKAPNKPRVEIMPVAPVVGELRHVGFSLTRAF